MRKLLLSFLLVVSFTSSCFAYGSSYDLGYQLGTAISNSMANAAVQKGRIKRDCHIEKNYDFSKTKSFVVATILNSNAIDDPSIHEQSSYMLTNLLNKDFTVYPQPALISYYFDNNPNAKNLTDEELKSSIYGFIQRVSDAMIFIKINNYTESNGFANVDLEILVYPHNSSIPVMIYTESRYDVQSDSKNGTIIKILKKFKSKFSKTFEKVKLPNKGESK